MSLRRRLLAGILVLLVVAIGVADAVTYSALRGFLLGRLDEVTDAAQAQIVLAVEESYHRAMRTGTPQHQARVEAHPTAWLAGLALAEAPSSHQCATAMPDRPVGAEGAKFGLFDRVNPDVFVEVLTPARQLLLARPSGTCDPRPLLPRTFPIQPAPTARDFGAEHGAYFPNQLSFTTRSTSPGTTYRAEAVDVPGGIVVTASALTPDAQTLASTVRVEVITSVAVLVAAVLLALLVTRLGLRPLDEMTETAGAIARGDLGRRIRTTDSRSEVGRLGQALNGMLTQIEGAMAQRTHSEQRLRRFVADASHELRTPLTSVRGYAELLRKGAFGDEQARQQAASRIEHEAARMGVLVDDLLLLARLDQGRPLDNVPVDLASLARQAVGDVLVARHDHPLTVDAPVPVTVTGDAVRLRQVLDNLVGNALEHTPPGTPVQVSVGADGGRAVLRVADAGPGLAPDVAAQAFEPFFRGHGPRTGDGAGLGLAIVAAVAQAHGGGARLRPGLGGGCTVEVSLPLAGSPPPGPGHVDPADGAVGEAGAVAADGAVGEVEGGRGPAGAGDVTGASGPGRSPGGRR